MASYSSHGMKTRRDGERDGILCWILPPLLLGAVFAFCAMARSSAPAEEAAPAGLTATATGFNDYGMGGDVTVIVTLNDLSLIHI